MRRRRRFLAGAASIATVFGWMLSTVVPSHAALTPATLTIGIDNAPPAGHNWEFLDYFPNGGVNVHNGDTVHFKFNTASLDGFHTATLGKIGESLPSLAANNPTLVPDTDVGDAAGQQQFTPSFPPSNLPPGTCGSVATPCTYDGTSYQSSGALFSPGGGPGPFGTEWYIKVQLGSSPTQPSLINYFCRVHGPAMSASFTIVPDASTASTQADLDTAALAQYNAALAAGQAATAAVTAAAITTNANGTHTVSMHAGTESPDGRVQVLEMLPSSLSITAGDTVNWATLTRNDPHTVTFPSPPPAGFGDAFPAVCEGATGDTPNPTQNPGACAGGPPKFELHYAPQPIGPTVIASNTTQASSGVIDLGPPYSVGATNYSFTFPNAGTFTYQCAIHDHMTGQVFAAAAAAVVPALPKAGAAVPATPSGKINWLVYLAAAMLIVAAGSFIALTRHAKRN